MQAPRSIPAVLAAALAAGALCGGGAAASPVAALPDCLGTPQVRPAQVVFACGDANFSASKLQWTGWGEKFAAATGVGEVNDCTPNCAAGKFHHARIVLIASGTQTCPGGRTAYKTVTYAWIDPSPSAVAPDPTASFPCGPRR